MPGPLEDSLRHQKEWQSLQGEENESTQIGFFLHFSIASSQFVIPISDVQEVCEYTPPRPYPVTVKGHLGVINLRGHVIPMISMLPFLSHAQEEEQLMSKSSNECRLILLRVNNEDRFCILANSVRKVSLSQRSFDPQQTINLDGFPARALSIDDLLQLLGRGHAN